MELLQLKIYLPITHGQVKDFKIMKEHGLEAFLVGMVMKRRQEVGKFILQKHFIMRLILEEGDLLNTQI